MKEFCPNKKSKEFKELAGIFGEDKAYFLWMRNKGNELDKAPNGAESKLFNTLLEEFEGNRTEALKAKAKVYSHDFFRWFGDWVNDSEKASKVVDENGEPLVVWHGTNSELSVDKKGPAIYATDSPNMADSYYYSDSNVADDMELYYDRREESYALEREGAYERALDILENGEFRYSDSLIDDWYNFVKESHPEYGGFE